MLQAILPEAIDLALDELGANARNLKYKNDPVLWAKEIAGVDLWSKQKEIMYSVKDHRRTTVRASNGPGKTFVASVIAAWWIAMHPPKETIVVTTAPSFNQIKTNLFFEINARKEAIEDRIADEIIDNIYRLPGKINTSGNVAEWKLPNGNQIALGRKPADQDVIRTFAGIHRKFVLFIIDEAGGLPMDMFTSAERLTTNPLSKILAIGNPDYRGSYFYRTFYDEKISKEWNGIHISAYDSPAFTGEPCPEALRENLPDEDWVNTNLAMWGGPDDPRAKIAIFGDFPDSDETTFFSETAMSKADECEIEVTLTDPKIMGIDLSMWGNDESVAYLNQSNRIRRVDGWGQLGTQAAADHIHSLAVLHDADYLNIDSGGLGAPIISQLKTSHPPNTRKYRIIEMNASGTVPDKRRWLNAKAWWYDRLREDMNMGVVDLEIPRGDNDLRKQLTAIEYEIVSEGARAGAIKMESKKDMKARVGFSPDEVDALVYAHMTPEELEQKDEQTKKTVYEQPQQVITRMPTHLDMIVGIFDARPW